MDNKTTAVTVNIMGKEYLISCSDEERQGLLQSARFLDKKMSEIRNSGKIIGTDRIAVMAALNIAHELLTQGSSNDIQQQAMSSRIRGLQTKIEDALQRSLRAEI